jgi:DNA-binding response OmpR family regulator
METSYRALVVDDEEVVLASVERTLSREGFAVDKVLTAEDALAKLAEEVYDVVITDLMMPRLNGIELLGRIKEMELSVPTVMVTGHPTIKTAMEALKLGAVDYIPKPFTRQELLSPVSRALRRSENGNSEAPGRPSIYTEAMLPYDSSTEVEGVTYVLRKHSWTRRDGARGFLIGIEASFLLTVGVEQIQTIRLPEENEIITQGHSSITVVMRNGIEHHVYMPLSGRVTEANHDAVEGVIRGDIDRWLIRIEASSFQSEVASLKVRLDTPKA